ncbi:hypothetical protein NMG60_11029163 [Bertholletia excelsa]
MSLTYSLLLFLLCLPLHACNARPLGVIGDKLEKRFLLPKNDEKLSPVKIPVALKPSSSSRVVGGDLKLIGSKAKKLKAPEAKKPKDHETKISGASQTYELPSSVSWNMPHGKRGEEHPGFDLDYLPPRTHPLLKKTAEAHARNLGLKHLLSSHV